MDTGRPVSAPNHNRPPANRGYPRSSLTARYLVRGALVTLLVAMMLFGSQRIELTSRNAEAAFLSEVRKLLASDGQYQDFFGWGLALSDDTAVVGARLEDSAGDRAGAAYVLERDEGGADN